MDHHYFQVIAERLAHIFEYIQPVLSLHLSDRHRKEVRSSKPNTNISLISVHSLQFDFRLSNDPIVVCFVRFLQSMHTNGWCAVFGLCQKEIKINIVNVVDCEEADRRPYRMFFFENETFQRSTLFECLFQ